MEFNDEYRIKTRIHVRDQRDIWQNQKEYRKKKKDVQNKLQVKTRQRLIKNYSTVTIITVPDTYDIKGFIKYYDIYNKGEIKGNSVIQYKVYKPSQKWNTKEFSRLLDG